MFYEPKYNKYIITIVIIDGIISWYVSEKDIWVLDLLWYQSDYMGSTREAAREYIDMNISPLFERFDSLILNNTTINLLLPKIEKYKTTTHELRDYLKLEIDVYGYAQAYNDLFPSIYIDFDRKILYTTLEGGDHENYIPNGWIGQFYDFLEFIPEKERYWVDDDRKF